MAMSCCLKCVCVFKCVCVSVCLRECARTRVCVRVLIYLEEAAATLDVSEGGRGGVAGLEDGRDGVADDALGDRLVQAGEARVEAALEGGHELDAGVLGHLF